MATRNWVHTKPLRSVIVATVTLEQGDTSDDLEIPDFQDKTIHIYGGTFGTSTVSLKGKNAASATTFDIHRTDSPSNTYTSVGSALGGHVIENPRYLVGSASAGTGTGLVIVVVGVTPRG